MRLSAIGRDLFILSLGVLGVAASFEHEAPQSLDALGLDGPAVGLWAAGFLVGGFLSLIGGMSPDRWWNGRADEVQAAGCGLVGMAFLIWAVAISARSDTTLTSWMVFCVVGAGIFGQTYRVAVVAAGVPRLTRYLIGRQERRRREKS